MYDYFNELAKKYNVPVENILSIALNRYGIVMENIDDNRLRFNLNFEGNDNKTFFTVCVNTYEKSPFSLKDNMLFLEGKQIAKISDIEKDTCTSTYFRNNKKVITFNSNSRSKCLGCKFCGTYSLSDEDEIDFSTTDKIEQYFYQLLFDNNIKSMRDIENVTICTGCFESEDALIKHLYMVSEAFNKMNFAGSINYIGSQLRSYSKIEDITKNIDNFGIYLTIEKFLEREKFMRPEKASLTLEKAKELLSYCSSLGITTTFLYILGLESLDTVKEYFEYFKGSINKFPITQIFQDYTSTQEMYRCSEAKDIEYYLQARKIIDSIYGDTDLVPKTWESFRGLYYDDKNKGGEARCLKKMPK